MGYNQNTMITPFEGGTLAQARNQVLRAFAEGDSRYVWNMLKVLYISTAKANIIEECEKYVTEVETELKITTAATPTALCEDFSLAQTVNNKLDRHNLIFYKKIMLLCEKEGLTEFGKIQPRSLARPVA